MMAVRGEMEPVRRGGEGFGEQVFVGHIRVRALGGGGDGNF